MKRPRTRAAHLGEVLLEGRPHVVRFKDGRLEFRRKHGRKTSSVTLEQCARLLPGQIRLFQS
jgi:hypothetical protein